MEQGKKVDLGNISGHLNSFTSEEMMLIYTATKYFRELCKEVNSEFPPYKRLTSSQREEYKINQNMMESADSVLDKLNMTFDEIGVNIRIIGEED